MTHKSIKNTTKNKIFNPQLNVDTTFQFQNQQPRSIYKYFFITAWIIFIFTLGLTIIFYFKLPPLIPLLYTLTSEQSQLTDKNWIFILPFISFVIVLLHSLLIKWLKNYDEFLLRLWSGITVIWIILLLAVLIRIIILIT